LTCGLGWQVAPFDAETAVEAALITHHKALAQVTCLRVLGPA